MSQTYNDINFLLPANFHLGGSINHVESEKQRYLPHTKTSLKYKINRHTTDALKDLLYKYDHELYYYRPSNKIHFKINKNKTIKALTLVCKRFPFYNPSQFYKINTISKYHVNYVVDCYNEIMREISTNDVLHTNIARVRFNLATTTFCDLAVDKEYMMTPTASVQTPDMFQALDKSFWNEYNKYAAMMLVLTHDLRLLRLAYILHQRKTRYHQWKPDANHVREFYRYPKITETETETINGAEQTAPPNPDAVPRQPSCKDACVKTMKGVDWKPACERHCNNHNMPSYLELVEQHYPLPNNNNNVAEI